MASDFTWGTGRRKTAVARVRLRSGTGVMTINKRPWNEYFTTDAQRLATQQPLLAGEVEGRFDVFVNVRGGGPQGQADAVRLGIARALVKLDEHFFPAMKDAGFLTRDARVAERKKPGQRGARARFQFSKR